MTRSLLRRSPRDLLAGKNNIVQLISDRVPLDDGPQVKSTEEAMWRLSVPNLGVDGAFAPKAPFGAMISDIPTRTPWKEPKYPLPIDESISDLLRSSGIDPFTSGLNANRLMYSDFGRSYKKHKIVFKHELSVINLKRGKDLVINCPYEFVRQRISTAVGLAYDAKYIDYNRRSENISQISRASAMLSRAADIISEANSLISEFGVGVFEDKYTRKSDEVFEKAHLAETIKKNYVKFLSEQANLTSGISKEIKDRVSSIKNPGRPENAFWNSFIIDCSATWFTLTGRVPTQGNADFARFVRRANLSLGGTRDDFASPIKTAMEYLAKASGEDDVSFESENSEINTEVYAEIFRDFHSGKHYIYADVLERECNSLINHVNSGNVYARQLLNSLYINAERDAKRIIREFMIAGGVFDLR